MSTRVDEARATHGRPLGTACLICGSSNTWVEIRRESDPARPGGVGEWPYAVCRSCGHAVRGRRRSAAQLPPTDAASHAESDAAAAAESSGGGRDEETVDRPSERRDKPPRPKASDERVEELLQAAGYNRAITPGVLREHRRFATHAGKPGLPRWKAAVAVLNGAMGAPEVPHVREIYAEEKRRREVRRERAARIRKQASELAQEHAVAAREHVARVWTETGEGPTWRELAAALGVKGPLASAMIDALHRRGALTSTKEPRSLTVTEDWEPAASSG